MENSKRAEQIARIAGKIAQLPPEARDSVLILLESLKANQCTPPASGGSSR